MASYLLGIESPEQVETHPLRGALFENVVVTEALKHRFNRGRQPKLSFFRDLRGLECDVLYETGQGIIAIEAKSGSTVASDYFSSINRVAELVPAISAKAVVYGGIGRQSRSDCEVVPLAELAGLLERFDVDQEIAAFVKEKKGPAPDDYDLKTLDAVYATHIRPTLDRLDSACRLLGEELFSRFTKSGYAKRGPRGGVQGPSVLDASSWETTRKNYLIDRGFKLRDDRRIELKNDYTFTGYTGSSGVDFDIRLSITWSLGSDYLTRSVAINEGQLGELYVSIPYSRLDKKGSIWTMWLPRSCSTS